MKVSELTAQQITLLATVVAMISLLILFVDLGIKRSILRETWELREVLDGYYSGGSSEVRGGQAGGDTAVHDGRDDSGDGGTGPRFPANIADAPGGGIKSAAGRSRPSHRAQLNGSGAGDGEAVVQPAVPAEPAAG